MGWEGWDGGTFAFFFFSLSLFFSFSSLSFCLLGKRTVKKTPTCSIGVLSPPPSLFFFFQRNPRRSLKERRKGLGFERKGLIQLTS